MRKPINLVDFACLIVGDEHGEELRLYVGRRITHFATITEMGDGSVSLTMGDETTAHNAECNAIGYAVKAEYRRRYA